jgi:hypothetical protein
VISIVRPTFCYKMGVGGVLAYGSLSKLETHMEVQVSLKIKDRSEGKGL